MLELRTYQEEDAKEIITWTKNEVDFRKWSANIFSTYPIDEKDFREKYINFENVMKNGFLPVTAYDETGIVGHLFFRFLDKEKKTARMGLVIIDDKKRGKGYGKQLLQLALRYVFEKFPVERVTLGVFENNPSAYYCYRAAGFTKLEPEANEYYPIMGEEWKCIELEYKKDRKYNSLEEVRANIDRIDDEMIRLIAERGTYVKAASVFKKNETGVKAPNRVEAVIQKVRKKAEEYGTDPDMVEALYREMIARFINMEMEEFKNLQ